MGAATALLHGERDPSIAGELVSNIKNLPHHRLLFPSRFSYTIFLSNRDEDFQIFSSSNVSYSFYLSLLCLTLLCISGMVLDSAFADLTMLAEEMVRTYEKCYGPKAPVLFIFYDITVSNFATIN